MAMSYSYELQAKVFDRMTALESQTPKFDISTITKTQLALMVIESEEEKQKLIKQIESDAPKVEFAMAVRNLEGSCSVGEFAALIGMGRNTLFKKMRDDKVLMINNRPYQSYKDRELLCEVESMPYTDHNGVAQPAFQTRVTGKGQVFFEKKYRDA